MLYKRPRLSKYNNRKTSVGGIVYDSAKEARYAGTLEMLQKATNPTDRVVSIERQVKYNFVHNGQKICSYVLDFRVTYGDGRIEHIDVKGVKTDVYKIKKKLLKAFYDIDIVEV